MTIPAARLHAGLPLRSVLADRGGKRGSKLAAGWNRRGHAGERVNARPAAQTQRGWEFESNAGQHGCRRALSDDRVSANGRWTESLRSSCSSDLRYAVERT